MAKRPPGPSKKSEEKQPLDGSHEITLAEEIDRQIAPLIPQAARAQVVKRVSAIMHSEQFSGPIAHPSHLREYDAIVPGAANRIITMAEKSQEHNRQMEAEIVDAQISDQKRGMHFGLAALLMVVFLAFVAGMYGNNVLAGMLLGAGVLGVIGAFIKGRYAK